jgi:hypothetical protein
MEGELKLVRNHFLGYIYFVLELSFGDRMLRITSIHLAKVKSLTETSTGILPFRSLSQQNSYLNYPLLDNYKERHGLSEKE